MKAVILAAGMASRLRPLTDNTPKCLLKVEGETILERTINALVENNFRELVIVTGYLSEKIEKFVSENYPNLEVEYIYNEVYDSTNNIYSLWLAKDAVKGRGMMLLDSDIIFDPQILRELIDSPRANCLAMNSYELGDEEMKLVGDEEMKIIEISKTCSPEEALGESVGIEKFSAQFVAQLYDELDDMIVDQKLVNLFYEAAFQNLIERGAEIYIVDTSDLFSMEVDFVEDFDEVVSTLPDHL